MTKRASTRFLITLSAVTIKDQAAVVGIGRTPYWKRGQSHPETEMSMACTAILDALDDAGLSVADLDGFSIYAHACDPATVAAVLGVPEIRFAAAPTAGGGGSAGALGLAAAAIAGGLATCCVTLMSLQQLNRRLGGTAVDGVLAYATMSTGGGGYGRGGMSPSVAFTANNGMLSPGHGFSLITARHMHLYGTRREAFAEVCMSQRDNAAKRPMSLQREPLTLDDYFDARMVSDPLCLLDYTMESDGAVAVITVSADRAKDLKQPPAYIMASAHGGSGRWGPGIFRYCQTPDEEFASSGHRPVAERLYEMAGVGPEEVDVALLYDHFSPMVVLQLEDYGFCPIGEGGPFVQDGNIRFETGSIPVNTHGGNLSDAYIIGMTHIVEAVEQLRGTAINQVEGTEIALVTGGPASLPVSGTLLRR
ncbi:MAG: thiolase [Acidimicrobiia bacterium]|nr:thiolase [Acidimicrobiia bacterium]MYE73214.1 thiolase [Acidimicrobiia bacterium]MYJ62036.1 thiolase [Acidimicrobiia bacterium]